MPAQAVGEFRPPERQQVQHGLASRSWVPVALSFGTVIVVAIALVIYFSQHSCAEAARPIRGARVGQPMPTTARRSNLAPRIGRAAEDDYLSEK